MPYVIHLTTLFAIYAIAALGLNLVVGYTGLLSVAHAAFFGIGAYASTLMMTQLGFGFFGALTLGILITGTIAITIGLVLSRFHGDYYALASLGFNVITWSILLNWETLTRGPLGIPGISRPNIFGFPITSNLLFLGLALVILAIAFLIAHGIANSSLGRALQAIREDELALSVFGYRTSHYKLFIFVAGAMIAALAGALFAPFLSFIDPSAFTVNDSIFMLAIIIVGGLGNLRASLLGAALMVLLPEAMRFLGFPTSIAGQMRQVVYGLILVLLMLFRPQGLLGKYKL